MWIAGGNHNKVDHNRIYDNWRRGTMLFAVPDAFVCPTKDEQNLHGCDPANDSTSFNNHYFDNILGRAPGGAKKPNGLDFWWDSYPNNTGNCWHDNGTYTSDPPPSPTPGASVPGFLPEDCSTSNGTGNPPAEAELLGCFAAIEKGDYDPASCPWFETPPKPTQARRAYRAWEAAAQRRLADSVDSSDACALAGRSADCDISTIRR
jgi:hypothetical protein